MNKLLIFSISICFLLGSCRSARTIQRPVASRDTPVIAVVTPPVVPPDHAKEDSMELIRKLYQGVLNNRIGFTTFSAKIDVDYEDGEGKKMNVNAHVRMYKDSIIWVSITAILGIEGLRVRITPDSVKLIDKQNKVYIPRSIAYLQEVTALPLDLATLQDLLLGNPVFLDSNIVSYNKSGGTVSLRSEGEFFSNLFTMLEAGSLVQNSQLDDKDTTNKRNCYLEYDDYENKKEVNFSTKRIIHVADKKKLNVELDFRQYDFNEKLSFPFTVPKNYSQN